MVHQILVAELSLELCEVVDAVPRLDAHEWRMLAVRAPDADSWRAEVECYGRIVFLIEQRNRLYLALVEDNGIVLETLFAELPYRVFRWNYMMSWYYTPAHVAEDAFNGLVIVKVEFSLEWFSCITTRNTKCRVTAYLEVNLLSVGVMHMPNDVNSVLLQTIGYAEHETIRI